MKPKEESRYAHYRQLRRRLEFLEMECELVRHELESVEKFLLEDDEPPRDGSEYRLESVRL